MASHLVLEALQKHYFGAPRCNACKACDCAKSKFDKMDKSNKTWTIVFFVCLFVIFFVWTLYNKKIKAWCWKRWTGDLGVPLQDAPFSKGLFRMGLQENWKEYHAKQARFAKHSFKHMAQLDGKLVAPCNYKGTGTDVEPGECTSIRYHCELMGNLVTLYPQDRPAMSMYIHPQDTIAEIMEKFDVPMDQVLVFRGACLEDLDKVLLEYGVPDNRKIGLLVEPRCDASLMSTPTSPTSSKTNDDAVHEIFQRL